MGTKYKRGGVAVNSAAVTAASRLELRRFGSRDGQLQPFRFAHRDHARRGTNPVASEQAMQIVDAMHWLAVEGDDDVTGLQARARRRTFTFDRRDQDAARLDESVRANGEARQRNVL